MPVSSPDPVSLGIQAGTDVLKIGLQLLAQHTARLKDARNENAALDNVIGPFDADVQGIADAFNHGDISRDDAISKLLTVDSQTFQYLRKQVGPAGTAWSTPELGQEINATYSADCNKACTAGCCVYNNNLRPVIFGRAGLGMGLIEAIQKGEGVINAPEVYPPSNKAYGNYSRAAYQIAIKAPLFSSAGVGVSGIFSQVTALFGGDSLPGSNGTSSGSTASPVSGILGGAVHPFGSQSPSGNLKGFAILAALFVAAVLIVARLAK